MQWSLLTPINLCISNFPPLPPSILLRTASIWTVMDQSMLWCVTWMEALLEPIQLRALLPHLLKLGTIV